MMFGNLFKKNAAPKWNELTKSQRANVVRKILNYAGAHYRVVQGPDVLNRERGQIETQNEDFYLNQYRRGRLLDQTRNLSRNSSTWNTILKQMDFNVCGTKAGKVILNFDDNDLNQELRERFSEFTRSADFFDGFSFNTLLKLILKTQLIGGDCCILFDDGLIENSGKLIVYESDEIGNSTPEALLKHYGKNATQSLGKVYNPNGRWIGTIVSRSCRGLSIFDEDKSYFLKRNPDESWFNSIWFMPQNVWRFSQGRGITQASSSIATIQDLEDLCGFELQAAKKNSQTFAQIVNTTKVNEDTAIPSAFDTDTDFSNMTDEEIEEAVKSEVEDNEKTVSFNKAASCGIVYEQLPENYKMELLDQKHPNQNIQEFIEWLAGRSSSVFGLSRAFATGNPTGADFRAQQLMTQPAFLEAQKELEKVCDWTFYRFIQYISKNKGFDIKRLPQNFMKNVDWSFPKLDDVDEVATQNANIMKLQNMTGSYREILGANWREKLDDIKEEIQWFKDNGLIHPSYKLISGGESVYAEVESKVDNEIKE